MTKATKTAAAKKQHAVAMREVLATQRKLRREVKKGLQGLVGSMQYAQFVMMDTAAQMEYYAEFNRTLGMKAEQMKGAAGIISTWIEFVRERMLTEEA